MEDAEHEEHEPVSDAREESATDSKPEEREADEKRSERRAGELERILDGHRVVVDGLREQHRVPADKPWSRYTDAERRAHRELTRQIGMANHAYARAVRAACARHRAEDGPELPVRPARARHPSRQEG